MKKTITTMILAAALTQSGCAFGTRYVDLSYPPENQVEFATAEAETGMRSGPYPGTVALAIWDKRAEQDRVGNIRNTMGMDTASVLTDDNVSIWVHDAIAAELNSLGYRVTDRHEPLDEPSVTLTADITKVYCDVYAMYDGEVTFVAMLTGPDGETLTREFPAKVVSGISFAGTGTAIQESIAQALQTAIRQMLLEFGFVDHAPISSG